MQRSVWRRTNRMSNSQSSLACAAVLLFAAASTASAQVPVAGTVYNETTGQPTGGVALTLVRFVGGMSPMEEALSGADGSFAFDKPLPSSGGQPMLGMVWAEHDGVRYSTVVQRSASTTSLRVKVYSTDERNLPNPDAHVVIFEPGGSEMVVNESFIFNNVGTPPRAFRSPERGTVRFLLPPEAKGVVQVMTSGPAGVPVKGTAEPTGEENTYKVDSPIKPGENRVDITYLLPHASGDVFRGELLYDGVATRIAAPDGVVVEGEALRSLGQEPRTKATLYETPPVREYAVTVTGQGRLAPERAAGGGGGEGGGEGGGGGGGTLRVAAAPIETELMWILALTGCIFAVGFYYLFTSRAQAQVSAPQTSTGPGPTQAAGSAARSRKRSAASRRK